ncbi:hypothetical protein MLD38_005256 [Melastoma candidum]|uniref:Uncharacterized protein n=1 Tax=Melastoma candidum TaxID=119954 RepID=A0ACB9S8D4_9MYRT|nr:hypothetical protein MLD38_005256 [Melastoma candidum]
MAIISVILRSVVRLVVSLVEEPASTVTTLLYYSDLLPRHLNLERLVRRDLLDGENYFFHFLIGFLRCFWYTSLATSIHAVYPAW